MSFRDRPPLFRDEIVRFGTNPPVSGTNPLVPGDIYPPRKFASGITQKGPRSAQIVSPVCGFACEMEQSMIPCHKSGVKSDPPKCGAGLREQSLLSSRKSGVNSEPPRSGGLA